MEKIQRVKSRKTQHECDVSKSSNPNSICKYESQQQMQHRVYANCSSAPVSEERKKKQIKNKAHRKSAQQAKKKLLSEYNASNI